LQAELEAERSKVLPSSQQSTKRQRAPYVLSRPKMFGGRLGEEYSGYGRKGPKVREATAIQQGARRVLLAAVAEAGAVAHVYVYRERVMEQANVSDMEAFWEIADYLARRGYITEGNPDYWTFSVTPRGIAEAAK
jgi:hypothetical protein